MTWIDLNERKPEEGQDVILLFENDKIEKIKYGLDPYRMRDWVLSVVEVKG